MRSKVLMAFLLGFLALDWSGPSEAATLDSKSILIIAKALNFITRKPDDHAKVIVVGDAADIAAVQAALNRLAVEKGSPADSAQAYAVFVGTDDQARAAHAANAIVVIIGADTACVDAGDCLIAVETQPKVNIYVSRVAAKAANVDFDPNFKMLVTEK